MVGGEPDERVLRMDRSETTDAGQEREEQILGHETPGEEADDGCGLAAEDGAKGDADGAPDGRGGHGSDEQQSRLSVVERVVDAAPGEAHVTDAEAERLAGNAEDGPGEQAGAKLRAQHTRASRVEQEGRPDRAVAVLAGHQHDPREGREDAGQAADAQQRALVVGREELRLLGEQPRQQREEEDDADHPQDQARCRTRRPDLQELRPELALHAACSAVSPRKTSSSEELSPISSWIGTLAANAMSPPCSVVVPYASTGWSLPALNRIPARPRASRSRAVSGVRMRTDPVARLVSCSSDDSTTSLPWLLISTSSTVCATSARTWLEIRTVRCPAAKSRRKSRSQWTPVGSSPLAGSSRINSSGSPS